MEKICTKCNTSKDIVLFSKNKNTKDGLQSKCKECFKKYNKNYRKSNPHKSKQYYQDNREKIIQQGKQHYQDNKEKRAEYQKQYYQDNKEEQYIKNRKRYLDNKERYDEVVNKWRDDNREYIRERQRIYMKKYRTESQSYRLRENIGHYIYMALKGDKNGSYKKYLGCSIEEYKTYLESMFVDGMSWDNYGTYWEIDHIKPCSSFNLTEESQQLKCFHYTNTQPLPISANRSKRDKWN